MKKILHLILDEKFSDLIYRDFERIVPGGSEYVILGQKRRLKYIKSFEPMFLSHKQLLLLLLSGEIKCTVFHSINNNALKVLSDIPSEVKVVWLGWGYDYYNKLLSDYYPNGLYLDATRNALSELRKGRRKFSLTNIKKNYDLILDLGFLGSIKKLLFLISYKDYSDRFIELVEKVDFFCPVLPNEFDLIKRKGFLKKAKYIGWNYGNYEDDYSCSYTSSDSHKKNILLGNSAVPENNHVEAIDLLAPLLQKINFDGKIVCPLSYGNLDYAKFISSYGKDKLGDKFLPLHDFIEKTKYEKIISTCGIAMMNQVRQQGVGNICSLLMNGSKVFMRKDNPLYSYIMENNGVVFEIEDISESAFFTKLSEDEVKKNKMVVMNNWSRSIQAERIKFIFSLSFE